MRQIRVPSMMGMTRAALAVAACVMFAGDVYAELQNIEVGGEIRIRGRYYLSDFNSATPGQTRPRRELRVPNAWLGQRPIGPNGVSSLFGWNSDNNDWHFYETATLLNFKADMTNDVSAYIEFYDFNTWGEDFRSNYITGVDSRANTADDIEVNQSYIQTENTFGMPLRVRIGRQALKIGKGWLVDDMTTPTQRLSFDGIRLTYDVDDFTVDAFAAKLSENGVAEEDGDVDFYGIYATYKALEPVDISAYWYLTRDARSLNDTNFSWFPEWVEDWFGVDNYDVTNLHTVGLRANGASCGFDYDLELAYQFGDVDAYGPGFTPVGFLYGDDDADTSNWGGDLVVGYTFQDVAWSPRVFLQGTYFSGEDNRDINFWDWISPFDKTNSSVSFNRLFSSTNYLPVLNDNGSMSNFYDVALGVEVQPAEKIKLHAHITKAWADQPFDMPVFVKMGRFNIPVAPAFSFWTQESSDDLGWEFYSWVKYSYSEDLSFMAFYGHLFAGEGVEDGSFSQFNGTDFNGGSGNDDADYMFWMTTLKF